MLRHQDCSAGKERHGSCRGRPPRGAPRRSRNLSSEDYALGTNLTRPSLTAVTNAICSGSARSAAGKAFMSSRLLPAFRGQSRHSRHPRETSPRRAIRRAASASPPRRSIPSGGSRPAPPRCLHGSTRGTGCDRACDYCYGYRNHLHLLPLFVQSADQFKVLVHFGARGCIMLPWLD